MGFHNWRTPRRTWDALKPRARGQRGEGTPAEQALWKRLRKGAFLGHKFRRQHAIGAYIVDFYCAAARLIVEVDGEVHQGQAEADALRERDLQAYGLRILRFDNEDVLQRMGWVLKRIAGAIQPGTDHESEMP